MSLLRLGYKRSVTSVSLTLLLAFSCERQVGRSWYPRLTASENLTPATCVILEGGPLPTEPRDECNPGQHLLCSLVRDPEPEGPS